MCNNARNTTLFSSDISIVTADPAWHIRPAVQNRPRGRKRKLVIIAAKGGFNRQREADAAWTSTTRSGMGNCGISACRCAIFISREIPRVRLRNEGAARSLPRGFEIGSLPPASAITVEITGDSISRWMAATRGVAVVYFLVRTAFTCLRNPLRSKQQYLSHSSRGRAHNSVSVNQSVSWNPRCGSIQYVCW